jgi:DedD protein
MNESAIRDVGGLHDGGRLRDLDRWRDKIEVKLDNRQVFFLFFGSAVVACMLFVLGVIVGKRIESRGRADAVDVQDPLAALDRAHEPPRVAGPVAPPAELTFPKALSTAPAAKTGASRPDKSALAAALPRPIMPSAPVPKLAAPTAPVLAPKPAVAAASPRPVVAPKAVVAVAAPKPVVAAPKAVLAAKPAAAPADTAKSKGKYTLQLSAFPTRDEAEAFAKKFDGTFIIPTDIPGKGTWYRVRCGNYPTYQEATTAKSNFEKTNKVIALVSAR